MEQEVTAEAFLFALADKQDIGLPYDIALWMGGVKKGTPQIGIWTGREIVPVSITGEPKLLSQEAVSNFELVSEFVKKNRNVLVDHWNGKLTDRETLNILESVAVSDNAPAVEQT